MSNMFKQSAFAVVEVKTIKKESKTAKVSGKAYDQYSIFGVTVKEGVGVNIRKSVYNLDKTQPDFINNKIISYEQMIQKKADKEKVFAFVTVNPTTKDGKTIMYDKASTYTTDAGKTGITIEAWATELPFEETDEGTVFKFKNSTKTKDECGSSLEVDMLVTEKDGNRISLIDDESSEFPVTMDVYLKEDIENNAALGQGYRFNLTFEKGKKVAGTEARDLDWDEEAKDNYAPDLLRVSSVGKIKGYTSEEATSEDKMLF